MGLINGEYLAADAKADEANEAHVSDMPGEADVVGVEIDIALSCEISLQEISKNLLGNLKI
jgi:hypothetical protein